MRSSLPMALSGLGALIALAALAFAGLGAPEPPPGERGIHAEGAPIRPDGGGDRDGEAPRPRAVVYTADDCTLYCPMQIRDLEGLGISLEERNVDRDSGALDELLDRDADPVLPSIALGDSLWRGYDSTHARAVLHKLSFEGGPAREGSDGSDRLVVYTRSDCPFSRKLLADLDALGVAYDNRVVDLDAEALAELVRLMGQATVPVSVLGGEIWPGYAEEHAAAIGSRMSISLSTAR